MAQPASRIDTAKAQTNGSGPHLKQTLSPSSIKRDDEPNGDDDNEAFPRKKRRKLAVDERKRAVKA